MGTTGHLTGSERATNLLPPRLYDELAIWWPIFSPPEDYVDEAASLVQILRSTIMPPPRTVLELGSGGGSNAFHLKQHFRMTLVDIAPNMLSVSRAINPECEHIVGDMRSVRLGREFDAVFIHDAIMYMTTEAELGRAIETAFAHCRPGGLALLVPDYVRENYRTTTQHGGRDGDGRALRYLEWQFDPDPSDSTYQVHWAFMLREGAEIRIEEDRHEFGLFARTDWLRVLGNVGFQAGCVTDPLGFDIFVAIRPTSRVETSDRVR